MNYRNLAVALLIFISFQVALAQQRNYEVLGNLILKSVVEKDVKLFKSLIIPEEAVWENFKKIYGAEWSKEEEQQAYLSLPENYRTTVEKDFMLKYNIMASKVELFDLDFDSMTYEVLNEQDRYDREMGVKRIFATIDHPKFKYFSFGMISYKDKDYLVDSRVDITEVNKYSERNFLNNVVMMANSNGELQSVGKFKIASNKADAEVFQCIIDNLILFGVDDTYVSKDQSKPSFIKGSWQFPYRINDVETYVGMVSFDFEYTLHQGELAYKFDNYQHTRDGSGFRSLGLIPYKYDDRVAKVFEQNDFYEILYDTRVNVKTAIKYLKQATDRCINN